MTRTLRSFVSSIVLAAATVLGGACATDEVTTEEPLVLQGEACGCTTDACRAQYVEDNLGCDVCVMFDCGGERTGACSSCADRPEHAGTGASSEGNDPSPAALGGYRYTRGTIARASNDPAAIPGQADTIDASHHRPPHATPPQFRAMP